MITFDYHYGFVKQKEVLPQSLERIENSVQGAAEISPTF